MGRRSRLLLALLLVCLVFCSLNGVEGAKAPKTGKKSGKTKSSKSKSSKVAVESAKDVEPVNDMAMELELPSDEVFDVTQLDELEQARVERSKKQPKKKKKTVPQSETRSIEARLSQARKRNSRKATQRRARHAAAVESTRQALSKADALTKRKQLAEMPANRVKAIKKMNWLKRQTQREAGGIISLDESQWRDYIYSGLRPYYTLLSFTALAPQQRCYICHASHAAISTIAQSYYDQEKDRLLKESDSLDSPWTNEEHMPIFFVEVDARHGLELFQKLGLNSAPSIMLLPPKISDKTHPKLSTWMQSIKPRFKFTQLTHMISPDDVANFVNKIRPSAPPLRQERSINMTMLAIYVLLLAVAVVVFVKYWRQILALRSQPTLFLVGGFLIYLFAISGGMYNIIREVPFSRPGEGGETYINRSGRDQYGAEGYLMGGANLLCALALILLNKFAFKSDDEASKPTAMSVLDKMVVLAKSLLSPGLCLTLVAFFWFQILSVYTIKNNYYRMGFLL